MTIKSKNDSLNTDNCNLREKAIWLNIGGSIAKNTESGMIGYGLDFNYLVNTNKIIKFKFAQHVDINILGFTQRITEFNVMFGFVFGKKYILTTMTAGLSYVTGVQKGSELIQSGFYVFAEYQKNIFNGIGVPIELMINKVSKYHKSGIGLGIETNINANISYIGVKMIILINDPLKIDKLKDDVKFINYY